MKLVRFGEDGKEKPGILNKHGYIIDVSSEFDDFDESFFSSNGLEKLSTWLTQNLNKAPVDIPISRLGPPISRPGKIICVGLNYSDHAKETKKELPKEPIIFFKASSAISGPNDNIIIPKGSTKTDWEVELAIVIGKKATYVSEEEAMDCVAGFVLHNDLSEREYQLERGGQWVKGKSADTFAPLGPFLATKDEINDFHNLKLWLKLNNKIMQEGNTKNLQFKIPYLISYLSNFMSLLPGDVISTGTPAGVGHALQPPRYLKAGDILELGIDGLGSMRQKVISYKK